MSETMKRFLMLALCGSASLAAAIALVPPARAQSTQLPAGANSTTNATGTAAAGELQRLVRATSTQFRIAYQHDVEMMERRRERLSAAVEAWRAAARSAENDRQLADWLRTAIRKSMPGSRQALPEIPDFAKPVAVVPVAPAPRQAMPTTAPLSSPTTPQSTSTPPTTPSPASTTAQKPVVKDGEAASMPTASRPSQPAAEESTEGGLPWDLDEASPATSGAEASDAIETPTESESAETVEVEQDFWTDHPANSDLPSDLSGDPFGDDP